MRVYPSISGKPMRKDASCINILTCEHYLKCLLSEVPYAKLFDGVTGNRRFLVFDCETGTVTSHPVDTETIYFNESFLILPVADEALYLRNQIKTRMAGWKLSDADKRKVKLRIRVRGYTADKRNVLNILESCFIGFDFYDDDGPDIDDVFIADDLEKAEIARRVEKEIGKLQWADGEMEPEKDQILLEALHAIYGD